MQLLPAFEVNKLTLQSTANLEEIQRELAEIIYSGALIGHSKITIYHTTHVGVNGWCGLKSYANCKTFIIIRNYFILKLEELGYKIQVIEPSEFVSAKVIISWDHL